MDNLCTIARARSIAVQDLQDCYDTFGIVAGRHHYGDYWTRDAAVAWLAALKLGDATPVLTHLDFLSRWQKDDGMIPFLVRRHLSPFAMMGVKIKIAPHPKFRSHKALYLSEVIDSNPWFAIGVDAVIDAILDGDVLSCEQLSQGWFAHLHPNLVRSLEWCLGKVDTDGLVKEGPLAGWNDGVLKKGATLLNNVLFYRAFDLWRNTDCRFAAAADAIKEALQKHFFNGQYFIDWIDCKPHHYFDSIGNFLSILWGVASEAQSQRIVDFASAYALNPMDHLVKVSYPKYASGLIDPGNRIMGLGEYWGGNMHWLEPSLLLVLALGKMGRTRQAFELLDDVAALICKYDGVYEVYEWVLYPGRGLRILQPVKRWNYRSEHPFARSAALFILACRKLGIA